MAVYEIAGIRFRAEVSDDHTKQYMEPYRIQAEDAPETIVITEEDLASEKDIQPYASAGTLYSCAVLRKVSKLVLYRYDGILIHAAALLYKEKAYLFLAPSGTGKTTHVMLWQKCLGDKMTILNGDKPFLRVRGGTITVYGGPWQGKENYGINSSAPLGGVFLLHRGKENTVRKASVPEALQKLLMSTVFPEDAEGRSKVLGVMSCLCSTVPVGILHCNMEDEAVYTVKKFIDENNKPC